MYSKSGTYVLKLCDFINKFISINRLEEMIDVNVEDDDVKLAVCLFNFVN